jgi:hypothetical protein
MVALRGEGQKYLHESAVEDLAKSQRDALRSVINGEPSVDALPGFLTEEEYQRYLGGETDLLGVAYEKSREYREKHRK